MFESGDVGWARGVLLRGCVDPAACPGESSCRALQLLEDLVCDVPGACSLMVLVSAEESRLSAREQVLLLQAKGRALSWLSHSVETSLLAVDATAQAAADAETEALFGRGVGPGRGAELPDAGREEIALALHVSPASAQGRLSLARAVRDEQRHPGLAGLLAAGRTSSAHARALVLACEDQPEAIAAQVTADRRVQGRLTLGVPWQVKKAATDVIARLTDPVTAQESHAAAVERRDVVFEPLPDGMGEVIATLAREDGLALMGRLNAFATDRKTLGDPRSAGQLRADALTSWAWDGQLPTSPDGPDQEDPRSADARAASAGVVRARVQVTLSLDALLGLREEMGRLGLAGSALGGNGPDGGHVPSATVLALVAQRDSDWQRFVHDEAGLLLGVSRAYRIPAELQRLIDHRYARCTLPGCTCRAHRCQVDHAHPWTTRSRDDGTGGGTHAGNTHPAHNRHHGLHTHHGWTPSIDPTTAAVTWTSPAGQTATTHPDTWGQVTHPVWGDPTDPSNTGDGTSQALAHETRPPRPPSPPPDPDEPPPF